VFLLRFHFGRFRSLFAIKMFAIKKQENGKEIHRRVAA
jgi:hypothetical protein